MGLTSVDIESSDAHEYSVGLLVVNRTPRVGASHMKWCITLHMHGNIAFHGCECMVTINTSFGDRWVGSIPFNEVQ